MAKKKNKIEPISSNHEIVLYQVNDTNIYVMSF